MRLSPFSKHPYRVVPGARLTPPPSPAAGIGVDDTFVVLSAWWRTRSRDPVPRRMADAYEEAAVSITITSLTDMFSFWVGVATPIPSVQIFCLYSGETAGRPLQLLCALVMCDVQGLQLLWCTFSKKVCDVMSFSKNMLTDTDRYQM